MKRFFRQPEHWRRLLLFVLLPLFAVISVSGVTLSDIYAVSEAINDEARKSHAKTESLDGEAQRLSNEYKNTLKLIEALRVYNVQLEREIASQNRQIVTIKESITEVTSIEKQITPLMLRMIEGLDQFVNLDMPFDIDERRERIQKLRDMMDRADIAVSEKFGQILKAYQIENEYGRTMSANSTTIDIDGQQRIVDVLQVGRVAYVYQTQDGSETGWWNKDTKQWEDLPSEFTTSVRNGLKMARKQLTGGLFAVPVVAPE